MPTETKIIFTYCKQDKDQLLQAQKGLMNTRRSERKQCRENKQIGTAEWLGGCGEWKWRIGCGC